MFPTNTGESIRERRAKFEANARCSPGNSPPGPNSATTRRVRSSFVSILPDVTTTTMADVGETTTKERRPSFSLSQERDKEAIDELRKTISNEAERRGSIPSLKDSIVPEQALSTNPPTPIPELDEASSPSVRARLSNVPSGKENHAVRDRALKSSTNGTLSGRNVSAPTMATSKAQTSQHPGSKAKAPPLLTKPKPEHSSVYGKASSVDASASSRSTVPGTTSRPRPVSGTLLAPTASSAAKHVPEDGAKKRVSSSRPLPTSSHLMAPTAASKAKHDEDGEHQPNGGPAATRPLQSLKKPRASLMGPPSTSASRTRATRASMGGHASGPAPHRSAGKPTLNTPALKAPSVGFLERMAKPTTASSSKIQDKLATAKADLKTAAHSTKATAPLSRLKNTASDVVPDKRAQKSKSKEADKVPTKVDSPKAGKSTGPAVSTPKTRSSLPKRTPISATKNSTSALPPPDDHAIQLGKVTRGADVTSPRADETDGFLKLTSASDTKAGSSSNTNMSSSEAPAPALEALPEIETSNAFEIPAPEAHVESAAVPAQASASTADADLHGDGAMQHIIDVPSTPDRRDEPLEKEVEIPGDADIGAEEVKHVLPLTPEPKLAQRDVERIATRKSLMQTPDMKGETIH